MLTAVQAIRSGSSLVLIPPPFLNFDSIFYVSTELHGDVY